MTKNLCKSTCFVIVAIIYPLAFYAVDKLPDYKKDVLPILKSHCMECHGKDKVKGKVRFDTLSADLINDSRAAETWDEASNSIKLGEMPPEDAKKQLTEKQRRTLLRWIDGSLLKATDAGVGYTAGVMRQMNKAEYQYTMEDLLGYKMNYADDVPADLLSPDGFRNNGASQGLTGQQHKAILVPIEKCQQLSKALKLRASKPLYASAGLTDFTGLSVRKLEFERSDHGCIAPTLPRLGDCTEAKAEAAVNGGRRRSGSGTGNRT